MEKPSSPGRLTSSTTRSTFSLARILSISLPLPASVTVNPWSTRYFAMRVRISSSSSTTKRWRGSMVVKADFSVRQGSSGMQRQTHARRIIWPELGVLVSDCSERLPPPDVYGCGRHLFCRRHWDAAVEEPLCQVWFCPKASLVYYGSASITVAALLDRGWSHGLTVRGESRGGLPGGAYEFWARSRNSVNG